MALTLVSPAERVRKIDAELTRRFPDSIVDGIAAKLPRFVSSHARANFAATIRDWAGGYMSAQDLRARKSEFQRIRDAELRFRSAAKDLLTAYQGLDPTTRYQLELRLEGRTGGFEPASEIAQRYLVEVMRGIERVVRATSDECSARRGRPKDSPRLMAVYALVAIYVQTTGQRPTLARNAYTGKQYSPFRKFCVAALTPIEGHTRAQTGIDSLIGRILYARK